MGEFHTSTLLGYLLFIGIAIILCGSVPFFLSFLFTVHPGEQRNPKIRAYRLKSFVVYLLGSVVMGISQIPLSTVFGGALDSLTLLTWSFVLWGIIFNLGVFLTHPRREPPNQAL